jgi:hypothetical protein
MIQEIGSIDPSWPVTIRARQAILWLAPGFTAAAANPREVLRALLALPWAAVYSDDPSLDLQAACTELAGRADGLVMRLYMDAAPPEPPPPNRLPVYGLRGPRGTTAAGDSGDPQQLLARFEKLRQAPGGARLVFVLGVGEASDLAGVTEACSLSSAFRRLIIASTEHPDLSALSAKSDAVTVWAVPLEAVTHALPVQAHDQLRLRVLVGHEPVSVDVTDCVDLSSPVTDSFELITADDLLLDTPIGESQIRAFFDDPTSGWSAYRAGLPAPRHREYLHDLKRLRQAIEKEGPSASATAWIRAEDGSGATTTIRYLCFDAAKLGMPVLVARAAVARFDFRQLSVFLTQAADRTAGVAGRSPSSTPWILAFDATHAQVHWTFLSGLCNGLRNLQRPTIVLVVRSTDAVGVDRAKALGHNRVLGSPLSNSISLPAGVALGEHLGQFLPEVRSRSRQQWEAFINRTLLPTQASRRSLFWVALRFWLFQTPGTGESFRFWLSKKLVEVAGSDRDFLAGILETAVLARYRLLLPTPFLGDVSRRHLRGLAGHGQNVFGLAEVVIGDCGYFTFAHPLIAEEILRIAAADPNALAAVDKPSCRGVFDLELHLLGRLIQRPNAGTASCLPIVEEIVTSALRVDQRASPRVYEERDRVVATLEAAPAEVWDASQVFNHHLAIARRHLAVDPPSADWSLEARREQLALAEQHLLDALTRIHPAREDSRESPLNLHVSLALTLDARGRLEAGAGDHAQAEEYRQRANREYQQGQAIDADNLYVLENFARFKLHRSGDTADDSTRVRLVIEAIALLELERDVDESSTRNEPIVAELGRAYEMLRKGAGRAWLEGLSGAGDEVAVVALARLMLGPRGSERPSSVLEEAEARLHSVPAASVTWRSRLLLYEVISELRPYDFIKRLDALRELDADAEFQWPMQLRLDYAILLHQVGDAAYRVEGAEAFASLRTQLRERSASAYVHKPLRYLRDPATGFREPLRTSVAVKNVPSTSRTGFAVPHGWGATTVAFRPDLFPVDRIRPGRELDCLIQFTLFGPQAVPVVMRVD